jgi:hypothetical protein
MPFSWIVAEEDNAPAAPATSSLAPDRVSHLSQKLSGLTLQDSSLASKPLLLASFDGLMPLG